MLLKKSSFYNATTVWIKLIKNMRAFRASRTNESFNSLCSIVDDRDPTKVDGLTVSEVVASDSLEVLICEKKNV